MVGSAAMKMMRSTSSTSIMGVTLISFVSPPPPEVMPLGSSRARGALRLGVADDRGDVPGF
jgi:hypothetical protein